MKIAVEGCAHGELETIYETIKLLEDLENIKVDLLICCGDFQAARNENDLHCMAIPPKYHNICSFYKYYNGEKEAPILTIFIGGNHEASNYLQELPFGGWVAPNIYYLGYAGVVDVAGVRIGGLSGIYKSHDFYKGHFEKAPYDENSKRSVYHIRNLEVFKLKQLTPNFDIFLSHDWPTNIWSHGNCEQLLRFKPFFKKDIETGQLGSKPCEELLNFLQPKFWFSAHLHCKFSALVQHPDKKVTKFLALDKCLPKRRFLQIVDVEHDENREILLSYDLEWLTVLNLTNHLLSVKSSNGYMPGASGKERHDFTPTEDEKLVVLEKLSKNLIIPQNFTKTAEGYERDAPPAQRRQSRALVNQQTTAFCSLFNVDDPLVLLNAFENADDSSFLDESFKDTSLNYTSFNVSSSTPSRTSLSLPKPKFDETQESFLEEREASPILADAIEANASTTDAKIVDVVESPLPKKFKRRNASIYADADDL